MNEQFEVGDSVVWENEIYFIDNTDENFKDDDEETSYLLVPIKYSDEDEYEKLFNSKDFDSKSYWVYGSYLSKYKPN